MTGKPSTGMTWGQARALAHRVADPLPTEVVPLSAAAGRTLAGPVAARLTLPACDNAAMDGYAVRGPGPWTVVCQVLAGHSAPPALTELQCGQAAEIATGAPVPQGAERVVPYEWTDRVGDVVKADGAGPDHIRRKGEFVRAGERILTAGQILRAAAIGLAASVGLDTLTVRRRPRVRILLTGDEVVVSGLPGPGQVRDAIGPTLATLLPAWGADLGLSRTVGDTAQALTRALVAASSTMDVIVVCGSSSVGPADHLHRALRDLGALVHIDGVACRPGHPQVLARLGSSWVIGLPGNPFAAFVAAWTIAQPLLAGLTGLGLADLPRAVLGGDPPMDDRHTRLVPVRWRGETVLPVDGARPGHLGAAAQADALAVVVPGSARGAAVDLLLLPQVA